MQDLILYFFLFIGVVIAIGISIRVIRWITFLIWAIWIVVKSSFLSLMRINSTSMKGSIYFRESFAKLSRAWNESKFPPMFHFTADCCNKCD